MSNNKQCRICGVSPKQLSNRLWKSLLHTIPSQLHSVDHSKHWLSICVFLCFCVFVCVFSLILIVLSSCYWVDQCHRYHVHIANEQCFSLHRTEENGWECLRYMSTVVWVYSNNHFGLFTWRHILLSHKNIFSSIPIEPKWLSVMKTMFQTRIQVRKNKRNEHTDKNGN